jgi:geranylgeranyl diphosphate synthase type I
LNSREYPYAFHEVLCHPLKERGRCLHDSYEFSGSLLPLLVCEAISGDFHVALPAAAAVEFLVAAGDVIDDIEDQDYEGALWRVYGQAQAVNAATALLTLARAEIRRLEQREVAVDVILRIMDAFDAAMLTACAGQYYDLVYENKIDVSEDMYFQMLASKSAPLAGSACSIGAMLATDDQQIIASFSQFGRNFGIAAQIDDDIHSLMDTGSGKSDIRRRKKTLPVIYGLAHCKGAEREFLAEVYSEKTSMTPEIENQVRRILAHSGGIHYSLIMAEVYRQKALKALQETGIPAERLKSLLTS